MLVDLHAHYPMHVLPAPRRVTHTQLRRWRRAWFRTWIVRTLSLFLNYQAPGDQPGVTVELMRQGDVGVIFSACGVRLSDRIRRLGRTRGSGRRADLVAEQLLGVGAENSITARSRAFRRARLRIACVHETQAL